MNIRNLDEKVKRRLQVRAARHGRSMEAEVRAILTEAVREPADSVGLFTTLLDRFGALIAAICRSQSSVLATRNVSDFDGTGIEIVDPWIQ